MTSFCGVPAAFRTCKTAIQRLSTWVHVEPNFLAFECIRLLLNVLKCLLEWLPKSLRALLVFGNNIHKERCRAVAAASAVPLETQKISSQQRDRDAKNSKTRNNQSSNAKPRLSEVKNPSIPCALINPIPQTAIIPTPNMMGYPPPGYRPFGHYPHMSHPPFGPTAFSYSTAELAPMQNTDTFPTAAVTDRVKARPIPPARSPSTNPTARIVRRERRPGCWNCLETGHYYTACTKPKQRFCHACGEPGQLARSCSGCSGPKPGNE